MTFQGTIHSAAIVDPSARIGENVAIYPFVYVGEEVVIEDGVTLHPGVVIGDLLLADFSTPLGTVLGQTAGNTVSLVVAR